MQASILQALEPPMPDEDQALTIHTPGDAPVEAAPAAPALNNVDEAPDVAALKAENAQLRATVELLNQQLMDIADGQAAPSQTAEPKEARLIGQDWSSMTSAEARAKGCTQTVLCRDGYYIPG